MLLGLDATAPLSGDYPPITAGETSGLPERMRKLLIGQSSAELGTLLSIVNRLLESDDLKRAAFERLEAAAVEGGKVTEADFAASEVRSMLWCMEHFEPEGREWAHLFACLSLALLNEAAAIEIDYTTQGAGSGDNLDWRILFNVTPWTSEAIEAGAFAEALSRGMPETPPGASYEPAGRARISLQNQRAAFARHATTDKAVRALTEYYRQKNHKTYAAAVTDFCEAFPVSMPI